MTPSRHVLVALHQKTAIHTRFVLNKVRIALQYLHGVEQELTARQAVEEAVYRYVACQCDYHEAILTISSVEMEYPSLKPICEQSTEYLKTLKDSSI